MAEAPIKPTGLLKSFSVDKLLGHDQLGEDKELQWLRATYRDVLRSLEIRENQCHLAIKTIEIYERLSKDLPAEQAGRKASQSPDGAVSYSSDGPLLFSQEGIKDPWVRYFGIAHSIERLTPSARGGRLPKNEHEWLDRQLREGWVRALFGHAGSSYDRIRCNLEIHEGFLRSESLKEHHHAKEEKKRMEQRTQILKRKCFRRPTENPRQSCCDCYPEPHRLLARRRQSTRGNQG